MTAPLPPARFTIRPAEPADLPALYRLVVGLAAYERLEDQVVSTVADFERALFGGDRRVEAVLLRPAGGASADEADGPAVDPADGSAAAAADDTRGTPEPVAFALFFHNFSTFLGRRGLYLEDLFVMPEHRGRGYGKALLIHLAGLAVARGCGRFEWSVLDWNVDAQAFYRSLGATVLPDWRITRVAGDALGALAAGRPEGR